MQRIEGPFRVFIGIVPTGYLYPETIAQTIYQGMVYCGVLRRLEQLEQNATPTLGTFKKYKTFVPPKIIVKPDVGMADPKLAQYCYTHPEVTRAVVSQILRFTPSAKISISCTSSANLPTERILRRASGNSTGYFDHFRMRGYYELKNLFPQKVDLAPLGPDQEKDQLLSYQLSKGEIFSPNEPLEGFNKRAVKEVVSSSEYYNANFTVFCPKLKTSVLLGGLSGAIALGGALPGAEKGTLRDYWICDTLEVCNPSLVVSDGIIAAAGGGQFTARGQELGVVLLSNNALAHDWIASKILSLDPMKIPHLKIAKERGWGPASSSEIELGGAGQDGLQYLKNKAKTLYQVSEDSEVDSRKRLALIDLKDFSKKFEAENEKKFPMEILTSDLPSATSAQNIFLDWLLMSYDFSAYRKKMTRWPHSTACIGPILHYPKYKLVYCIGEAAVNAVSQMTSQYRVFLKIPSKVHRKVGGPTELRWAKLKNGKWHWLLLLPDSTPSHKDLFLTFWIGSFGRVAMHFFRGPLLLDALLFSFRKKAGGRLKTFPKVALTSRMTQNSWWALKKPVRPPKLMASSHISVADSELTK